MLPTELYIAAFAAFLIPPNTRLPAFLCAFVQCVTLNFESISVYHYEYYYIAAFWASFISCRVILCGVVTRQKINFAILFFVTCLVDTYGLLLFVNYCEPSSYNVTGFYVILTQMLLLLRDGHGQLAGVCAHIINVVRRYLSVQSYKGKEQ